MMAERSVEGAAGTDVLSTPSPQVPNGSEIEILTSPQKMTPSPDPLSGDRAFYLNVCIPLYQAALKGDWETARGIFEIHPTAVRVSITRNLDTVLHIAATAKRTHFVEEVVGLMDPNDLELQNQNSNTALCFAAAAGTVRIAEVMVKKNDHLPMIRGNQQMMPLHMAALLGHSEMVWYLYNKTNHQDLTDEDWIGILNTCISTDLYEVALAILESHPKLATIRDGNYETALHLLARKPSAFSGETRTGIWTTFINSISGKKVGHNISKKEQALKLVKCLWKQVIQLPDSKIADLIRDPYRLVFVAAELGNTIFLTELLHSYPDLLWRVDSQTRSIFHIAALHRQDRIFNLIYEIGSIKDMIMTYRDENGNNMLHLVGKLAHPSELNIISGAALQMQRELLWFKTACPLQFVTADEWVHSLQHVNMEVEKLMQPTYREKKNRQGKTPWVLFTEEHRDLMKDGEKWMRETAAQSMLVATLIATVVFSAAFTVPGGHSQQTDTPILLMVFAVSDGLALFTSSTSILMFLSILTSRYAEQDFLHSLPSRLMFGLTTLFVSIITMMVTFTITFFIVYRHGFAWVPILIALFATGPVSLFASLQYPLLADVINSTYGSRFLFEPRKHMFDQ